MLLPLLTRIISSHVCQALEFGQFPSVLQAPFSTENLHLAWLQYSYSHDDPFFQAAIWVREPIPSEFTVGLNIRGLGRIIAHPCVREIQYPFSVSPSSQNSYEPFKCKWSLYVTNFYTNHSPVFGTQNLTFNIFASYNGKFMYTKNMYNSRAQGSRVYVVPSDSPIVDLFVPPKAQNSALVKSWKKNNLVKLQLATRTELGAKNVRIIFQDSLNNSLVVNTVSSESRDEWDYWNTDYFAISSDISFIIQYESGEEIHSDLLETKKGKFKYEIPSDQGLLVYQY